MLILSEPIKRQHPERLNVSIPKDKLLSELD